MAGRMIQKFSPCSPVELDSRIQNWVLNLLAVKPQTSYLISLSLCLFVFLVFFLRIVIFKPLDGLSEGRNMLGTL